ncbi:TRAP-type C4-dicarboxylate transport system, small permease component [Tistlia consotensis]|uniref:TRAP transporter small permease protein n=1 Tax=Tistlia consotensis USBA 355 TaxID=560819 RepID=A0A1Y6B9K1_9PROT|nr:TRAP transporter small permease subunit [Tistlia consotensis]SME98132.1 TRAP-type C4-dicarboxylate transport system, small permease component [Tistlia consotensis USBA 355]SNR57522.1 TRAP-type C4-dicarboxylate transport system, small permease component [Tistlia consotensis]
MAALLALYWRVLRLVELLEITLGVLLLAGVVAAIGAQVVSRYLLGTPLVWVEEFATYAFIWATFLGTSVGLKRGRQIQIATFVSGLAPRREALFRTLAHALVLALLVLLARQALKVMPIEGSSSSVSLPVQLPRDLFYSLPLFVSMVSMAATTLYFLAAELRLAATGERAPHLPQAAEEGIL